MGAVYLARRVDGQFEQTVALKVMAPHLAGEEFARCFRNERGAGCVVMVAPAASADDIASCRAAGATLLDLSETNPTLVGLGGAEADVEQRHAVDSGQRTRDAVGAHRLARAQRRRVRGDEQVSQSTSIREQLSAG